MSENRGAYTFAASREYTRRFVKDHIIADGERVLRSRDIRDAIELAYARDEGEVPEGTRLASYHSLAGLMRVLHDSDSVYINVGGAKRNEMARAYTGFRLSDDAAALLERDDDEQVA